MRWFMAILCHYPETQKKVSDEIDQFIKKNGRIPDFSDRLEVPFCISVLKECIRFRPTGLLALPHIVTKDSM
jgi:cytochrome P450